LHIAFEHWPDACAIAEGGAAIAVASAWLCSGAEREDIIRIHAAPHSKHCSWRNIEAKREHARASDGVLSQPDRGTIHAPAEPAFGLELA
jgi:hypothetical protein